MDSVEALRRLGGVGRTSALLELTTSSQLRRAVAREEIVRVVRSRYVLAGTRGQRRDAAGLAATLSHLSAAQHHGWALQQVPEEVWVPRNRKVNVDDQARCQ